ncbi:hypothetical protein H1R20_g14840, partial [Candolleomyces eurysporus]
MAFPTREKYKGRTRRLLLAFDIGTTFSGISYSILDPEKVPEILPVTRYPSQERAGGDIKIPTVIYYDKDGKPCKTGAETLEEGIEEDAEDNGWNKAHWFKLHLRPKPRQKGFVNRFSMLSLGSETIPSLPLGKTVVQVFADYMRYLHECAKTYIEETHGEKIWSLLRGDIMYILTHPNGWGGPQQAEMRQAAIQAGFIPDTVEGHSRVTFVTEGEASLHFCLSNGLSIAGSDENSGVLIVDAGGGTIDITSYRKLQDHTFEEIAIPACHFQGAVYVTMRAEAYFKELLSKTRFRGDIPTLTRRFDRTTKHVFRRDDEPLHIQFASNRERDQTLNIRGGRMTLDGQRVATFFEPSISCIVEAIKTQQRTAHFPIKSVFLVGGFSASTWLYEKVKEAIRPLGIAVSRPDTHVNKAVANGAVSFYLDAAVKSRVARLTYGIETFVHYDRSDPSHVARAHLVRSCPVHGRQVLYDHFSSILAKVKLFPSPMKSGSQLTTPIHV